LIGLFGTLSYLGEALGHILHPAISDKYGRTLFTYGKDWYAVSLLRMAMRHNSLAQLKNTRLANLLEKPRLRAWLGALGKKSPTPEDLNLLWPEETETYRLTASLFDGWTQTSRKGKDGWNIVLQINLNENDARLMERKFPNRECDPFEYCWHPIHEGRHRTLAWARIDLDWDCGEALIEEIQNDRLREVGDYVARIRREGLKTLRLSGHEVDAAFVLDYWNKRLRLSRQWWDEAMLSAAVGFIVNELGIRRIFYHSPLSGAKLKGRGAENAPTSIYTDLPKRFCFEKTRDLPAFIKRRRSLPENLWMHRITI
jgi:hypothetical protein